MTLRIPRDSADLDETPVQVAITTESRRGVLMVPVTALLAGPNGGYQVRVVRPGAGRELVGVQPGLFDDLAGTVEVTGGGLSVGLNVEVPASS